MPNVTAVTARLGPTKKLMFDTQEVHTRSLVLLSSQSPNCPNSLLSHLTIKLIGNVQLSRVLRRANSEMLTQAGLRQQQLNIKQLLNISGLESPIVGLQAIYVAQTSSWIPQAVDFPQV